MYIFFLYVLFFSLPLIHTKLFDTLFISTPFFVSGNFEFTKVVFFHGIMSLVLWAFCISRLIEKKRIVVPKNTFLILIGIFIIVSISTFFSLSPYISLFGNTDKSHGFFVFSHLIALSIVLYNTPKKHIQKIISVVLASAVVVGIISLKEYFFPTFHYGELATRAIGTFGHPNYLAAFLLVITPLIPHKKIYIPLFILIGITLLLTQSVWGIFLGILLAGFYAYKKYTIVKKYFVPLSFAVVIFAWIVGYFFIPVEKLHSFLSRFYLWETTIRIILSDWKIFVFGAGTETLNLVFNSFKSPYLYIYENFWYTADRPHNFFFNIWYHFWILWASVFGYMVYIFGKHIFANGIEKYELSVLLFFLFCIFNYPSVWIYSMLILVIIVIIKEKNLKNIYGLAPTIFMYFLLPISLFGAWSSSKIYVAEIFAYQSDFVSAKNTFSHPKYFYTLGDSEIWKNYDPLPSEQYYKSHIQNFRDIERNCEKLTQMFPSVENYFYCGNILERLQQQKIAYQYYELGLEKLPDLWNPDSIYWQNPIIQNSITGNRFLSPKFSNLQEILEKTEKILK